MKLSYITPIYNRQYAFKHMLNMFEAQHLTTIFEKELIIVDDSDELLPDWAIKALNMPENVKYIGLPRRHSIGEKRNIACQEATGGIILHFDSDDTYEPNWGVSSANFLIDNRADITGLSTLNFTKEEQLWQYKYRGSKPWVAGATMCYKRDFWLRHPFRHISMGEDNHFVWSSNNVKPHTNIELFTASIHSGNTSPRSLTDKEWTRIR